MVQFSEETKERVSKVIDVSRVAIHYGYLPLIIYLGKFQHSGSVFQTESTYADLMEGYTYSEPKPSLFKLFSPLA
ncbi:hypothetical protein N7468_001928 [Penicillium chermesinum]|uniref:Mitochondrial outer membrane translocase complex, subunit Tom7 n=1 Tax=Penicillium chermesinum TaxID=63820 RepID=A0A9W9PHN8_9EURO|nr:uncharacterized protein N7468_001928 [Penicillium chermesinum]KAJ5246945.1 hypothetical protein N7468_001928 [Penicillium chermesinum]KAJ6145199.1 hypothetical protein N7470_009094 [Penicillium chermesinum]